MNILIITNDFEIGGVQKRIYSVLKNLDSSKYKIYLITVCAQGNLVEEIKKLGIEYEYFPCIKRLGKLKFPNFFQVYKLSCWIKRKNIDLVETHLFLGGFFGRLAAIKAKVPRIYHTEHSTYFWKKFYHRWIDKFLAHYTQKIIAVSKTVKDFAIKQENLPEDKFVVIYPGINVNEYLNSNPQKIRKEFEIPDDFLLIIGIGRLVKTKGFDHFIYSAEIILKYFSKIKFILVGDGPEKEKLQNLSSNLGISNSIIFTGWRKDVDNFFAAGDIFVLPSFYEGAPLTFLEIIANSKPIVCYKIPSVQELLPSWNEEFMVLLGDYSALARKIIQLIEDAQLRDEVGKKLKEYVIQNYSIEKMINQIEKIYAQK